MKRIIISTYKRKDTCKDTSLPYKIRCYLNDYSEERAKGMLHKFEPVKDSYDVVTYTNSNLDAIVRRFDEPNKANKYFLKLTENLQYEKVK